jgi:hypothetical protein
MNIYFEKEICEYLSLPSIPKKKWDGKSSFTSGVAITNIACNNQAYAVCTFNAEHDKEPRVIKAFSQEMFFGIEDIFVVPQYMETDVDDMDLDDESKKAAERLAQEAKELYNNDIGDDAKKIDEMKELPEWIFPEISNKEEARAWLTQYNSTNKIRGRIPDNVETIKMRLLNIYYSQSNRK